MGKCEYLCECTESCFQKREEEQKHRQEYRNQETVLRIGNRLSVEVNVSS